MVNPDNGDPSPAARLFITMVKATLELNGCELLGLELVRVQVISQQC